MGADRITQKVHLAFPATDAERDEFAGRVPQRALMARGATNNTPKHGNQQNEDQQLRERLKAEAIAYVTGQPIKTDSATDSTTDNRRN